MSFLDAFGYFPPMGHAMEPGFTLPQGGDVWGSSGLPFGGVAPDWSQVPVPSMEGAIGGNVNPLAPGSSEKTTDDAGGSRTADTDVSASAIKKSNDWVKALSGVKAPPPPKAQEVRSPAAPQTQAQKSQLSTLLASMGITPQQLLTLGQAIGRR